MLSTEEWLREKLPFVKTVYKNVWLKWNKAFPVVGFFKRKVFEKPSSGLLATVPVVLARNNKS